MPDSFLKRQRGFRRTTRTALLVWATLLAAVPGHAAVIGEGPQGADNGLRYACTGFTSAGVAVICVRAGAAAGGTGTASAPLATVAAALAGAKAGDTVQVAAGTYRENLALGSLSTPSSKRLSLLGGFSADFAARDASVHRSVLDGQGLNPAIQLHLGGSGETVLDGFEITGGVGLGTSWQNGYGHGGGVYATLGSGVTLVISHNRIRANRSRNHTAQDSRGGGVYVRNGTESGGGSLRIEDNVVEDNLAGKGAGITISGRQALLLRNRIANNTAHSDHGGGVYLSTAVTELRGNIVRGNVVGATAGYGWGGGLMFDGAVATTERNLITDNSAPSAGSGVFWDEGSTGTMRNDLVVANRCTGGNRYGAALYVDGGPGGVSRVTAEHLTIAGHACAASVPGGAAILIEASSTLTLKNSILWGNTREFATNSGGSFAITHSITAQAGTGNRNVDPLFVSAAGGDYHVQSMGGHYSASGWVPDARTSPAVDAGDVGSPYASEPAPNGGRVNLGAYGNTLEASRSFVDQNWVFGSGFE